MLEVIVVGSGLAGFGVALALWERGAAVTLVDAGRPGGGATGASAGMLAAQYESTADSPKFRLCLESRRRYPVFAARVAELCRQDLGIRWDGMLVANLCEREHVDADEVACWQREAALRAEVVGPEEAARIQPGVSGDVVSYLWLPDEGQLDSQALGAALGAAIASTDIRLIAGNGVREVKVSGGAVAGVLTVDGRSLDGERVVLAAGAWSGSIAGASGRRLPVRPVRGQIVRLAVSEFALGPIIASHAGRYVVPRGRGTVIAGSTMEEVGFDRSITEEGCRVIQDAAAELIPALAGRKPLEQWAGLRPISADSSPIIGPDPEIEGLFYATGYGRDGILLSPLVGDLVAELIVTGETELDWHPFRIGRFTELDSE
ncbi:MAG: glycine oxidase ThiO [Gemmatimonadota bacterium]|nr:MAG: glycine oxidase ThiO [Gemmatimonadota bacterium]